MPDSDSAAQVTYWTQFPRLKSASLKQYWTQKNNVLLQKKDGKLLCKTAGAGIKEELSRWRISLINP